jgi:hypothetical protein
VAFINGYLALCSAVGLGFVTEASARGYTRQPIAFPVPEYGVSMNSKPWNFAFPKVGTIAGRAVYDAPSGGNLLLVLPFAEPRTTPADGPTDAGNVGDITLIFGGLGGLPDGAAFNLSFDSGAVVGSVYDLTDTVSVGAQVSGGGYEPVTNSSPMSAGVELVLNRGVLAAHAPFVN